MLDRPIHEQGALLDLSWQAGVEGLLEFTGMLAALEREDCAEAKRQALDSVWARKTPERANRVTSRLCE